MDDMTFVIKVNCPKFRLAGLLIDNEQVFMQQAFGFTRFRGEFRPALANNDILIQVVRECGRSGYSLTRLPGNRARPTPDEEL